VGTARTDRISYRQRRCFAPLSYCVTNVVDCI
jgi:hypothetical protein